MGSMSGERNCSSCGASMQQAQDWCLQCGRVARGNERGGPGWRSAALAIGATTALVLGAAAAAYAALEQHAKPRRPPVLAQTPTTQTPTTPQPSTPGATTPSTTAPGVTPPVTTPGATTGGGASPPGQPETLEAPTTLPRVPSQTPTPGGHGQPPAKPAKGKKGAPPAKGQKSKDEETGKQEEKGSEKEKGGEAVPLLLDPNAAEVYNPEEFPASRFGDPSLAIDGETTTAWSVGLEPAQAPRVDAGLSLNLHAAIGIAKLTLITETPGITVQIYGTSARKLPTSLSSEEWVRLSRPHLVKQRKGTIELQEASKRFRSLLIWILKAPVSSSSGEFTATEAKINELQLYEAK